MIPGNKQDLFKNKNNVKIYFSNYMMKKTKLLVLGFVLLILIPLISANSPNYVYDDLDRLTMVDYPGEMEDVKYEYYGDTNIIFTMNIGAGTYIYTYDENGDIKKEEFEGHPERNVYYEYYSDGKIASISRNGIYIDYSYDSLGRIRTEVTVKGGITTWSQYKYDSEDRITKIITPSRISEYSYDSNNNLISEKITEKIDGQEVIEEFNYEYDDEYVIQQTDNFGRKIEDEYELVQETMGGETYEYTRLKSRIINDAYAIDYVYEEDPNTGERIVKTCANRVGCIAPDQEYNNEGLLVRDNVERIVYTYNDDYQPESIGVIELDGEVSEEEITYAYEDDLLAEAHYKDGSWDHYKDYDALDRIFQLEYYPATENPQNIITGSAILNTITGFITKITGMPVAEPETITYYAATPGDLSTLVTEEQLRELTKDENLEPETRVFFKKYRYCTDNDLDYYYSEGGICKEKDCDDNNPLVNPSAEEICDDIDNNCNGEVDEDCEEEDDREEDDENPLKAHYLLDSNANDISGNNYHGNNHGAVFVDGLSDQAASFDGINDYIDMDNMDVINGAEELTISGWIKANEWGGLSHNGLICDGSGGDETICIIYNKNTKKIIAQVKDSSGTHHSLEGFLNPPTNEWLFLAVVWNKGSAIFYVNGDSQYEYRGWPNDYLNSNQAKFMLGNKHKKNWFFNGLIDDVKVYNKALTRQQIQEIYQQDANNIIDRCTDGIQNNGEQGIDCGGSCSEECSDPSLVAYYPLDDNADDQSGNNHHGAITQGLTFVDGLFNKAASLNDNNYIQSDKTIFTDYPITLSAWVKTTGKSEVIAWVGNKDYGSVWFAIQLWSDGTARTRHRGGNDRNCNSNVIVNDGQWHHIVGQTISNTRDIIYVDGIISGNCNFRGSNIFVKPHNRWAIGRNADKSPTGYFNGLVDDVRFYNRRLSSAEVQELYEEGLS